MTVSTDYATTISSDFITLNGTLIDLHEESSLTVSFEWGTTSVYGNETISEELSSLQSFSADISKALLNEFHSTGDFYFFRAKATNGVDIWYGNNRFFINLNVCGLDPYVIDDAMSSGTLTDLMTFNDVLYLSGDLGLDENTAFNGMSISSGGSTPRMSGCTFAGMSISGGTII